eukprot:COSAG04_NODE_916_length_9432_cov_11.719383_8_plen_88_part_00
MRWGLASRVHVTFWRRQLAAAPLLRRRFGRGRGVVRRFSEGTSTSGAAGNWPNGLHFGEACLGRGQRASAPSVARHALRRQPTLTLD